MKNSHEAICMFIMQNPPISDEDFRKYLMNLKSVNSFVKDVEKSIKVISDEYGSSAKSKASIENSIYMRIRTFIDNLLDNNDFEFIYKIDQNNILELNKPDKEYSLYKNYLNYLEWKKSAASQY